MQGSQARIGAALLAAALALSMTNSSIAQPIKNNAATQQQTASARGERIAAVVNDQVISSLDVRQRSALILVSSGMQPSAEALQQVRGQALRDLIDEVIQLQEAKERKIEPRESDVEETIGRIAKSNNVSVAQLTKELTSAGSSMESLRRQLRAELTWRRLVNARYGSRIRISNEEITDTLDRITANASRPQYRLAEILLSAEGEAQFNEAEKVGQKLVQEIRGGRVSFAAVARQFSNAPSAAAGGDLGWLSEADLRPELLSAIRGLKAGQVSPPLRTEAGVFIVAMREMKDGIDASRALRVVLRKVSAPVSSKVALDRARARVRGCETLANVTKSVPGAQIADLGEMVEADLSDELRPVVAETSDGGASTLISTGDTVSVMVVCMRGSEGGLVPSRDEVEERLYDQELSMLSQRYLTDLKREATIITR